MVARAEHRSVGLLDFVNDLLMLSEIRAAREIERGSFSANIAVDTTADRLRGIIESKGIAFALDSDVGNVDVEGNPALLEELADILVMNAVKYTPSGGKITLGLRACKTCSSVRVFTKDTGIGIPEEELSCIFDDFYRATNAKDFDTDGTGLGLSIAKQIVHIHGGRIWAESRINEGSTIICQIPVLSPAERHTTCTEERDER